LRKSYEQAEAFLKITEAQLLQGEYIDPTRNKISLTDFKHEVGLTNAKHKYATKRALEDAWESRVAPYPIADKSIRTIQLSKTQLDKLKDQKEKYDRPNCEYVFPKSKYKKY